MLVVIVTGCYKAHPVTPIWDPRKPFIFTVTQVFKFPYLRWLPAVWRDEGSGSLLFQARYFLSVCVCVGGLTEKQSSSSPPSTWSVAVHSEQQTWLLVCPFLESYKNWVVWSQTGRPSERSLSLAAHWLPEQSPQRIQHVDLFVCVCRPYISGFSSIIPVALTDIV